jgi:hypothetical protein
MFATTGQILASQRFSGPGLNAALISVHQSASPEPELSTPLGTVREELANFFENERLFDRGCQYDLVPFTED